MSEQEQAPKTEIDVMKEAQPEPIKIEVSNPKPKETQPFGVLPIFGFDDAPIATNIKFGDEGWEQEEARRLKESAGLNESIIKVPSGVLIDVEQGPGDFLIMVTSLGKKIAIHRVTALQRCKAALDMCLAETGGADPSIMDRDLSMIHMMFQAVLKNGRANGKAYNSKSVKQFEQLLLKAHKAWKGRSETTTADANVRRAYGQ